MCLSTAQHSTAQHQLACTYFPRQPPIAIGSFSEGMGVGAEGWSGRHLFLQEGETTQKRRRRMITTRARRISIFIFQFVSKHNPVNNTHRITDTVRGFFFGCFGCLIVKTPTMHWIINSFRESGLKRTSVWGSRRHLLNQIADDLYTLYYPHAFSERDFPKGQATVNHHSNFSFACTSDRPAFFYV